MKLLEVVTPMSLYHYIFSPSCTIVVIESRKNTPPEINLIFIFLRKANIVLGKSATRRPSGTSHWMRGWYKAAVDHTPSPAWVTLGKITAERIVLYHQVQPPGENISISIDPFPVEDLVPIEDDIEWAVRRLSKNRSGGPSGMREEQLWGWLVEACNVKADTESVVEKTVLTEERKAQGR